MTQYGAPYYTEETLNIVGSSMFGRFPKMSSERTYNMIVSDGWLVPFGGYKVQSLINNNGKGRGIYASKKLKLMVAVIDNDIWKFDSNIIRSVIGRTNTYSSDIYIAENNAGQIALSDSENIYIWNANTDAFDVLTPDILGFTPGYITFQNERFICSDTSTNQWRLSANDNGLLWPYDAQHVGKISTKATRCLACIRFPGKGNLLTVLGENVGEFWTNVGAQLFPYQRSQSVNIDYGLINASTLADNENMICWLGGNEQSGPVIMMSDGVRSERISTDGIDFEFSNLKYPEESYGFMVRVDGHLCYVITFTRDNLTYLYDFNTEKFYNLCDENMDAFIIKRIAFFNDKYYFVSIRDGNLYEFSANLFNYEYSDSVNEAPYIRVCRNIRYENQANFEVGYFGFSVQQGEFLTNYNSTNYRPKVTLTLSKDGGVNYGNGVSKFMYPIGHRQNRLLWTGGLGMANDFTPQLRFHGINGRFIATDGKIGVMQ